MGDVKKDGSSIVVRSSIQKGIEYGASACLFVAGICLGTHEAAFFLSRTTQTPLEAMLVSGAATAACRKWGYYFVPLAFLVGLARGALKTSTLKPKTRAWWITKAMLLLLAGFVAGLILMSPFF